MTLTPDLQAVLLSPIKAHRVYPHTGDDGGAYLAPDDVRAHLCRMFGHANFDITYTAVMPPRITGTPTGDIAVTYATTARICIHTTDALYDGTAAHTCVRTGEHDLGDALDTAVAAAEDRALARAAINLGDQFGLSLRSGSPLTGIVQEVVGFTHPAGPRGRHSASPAPHLTVLPGGLTTSAPRNTTRP